ncbi:RibD family protein [Synechococcus sp. RS9902]|uniref:RibD family protein n=1 Tax=Synechococcus sp. RS9902 TaxID=221345 RepID=UPI00164407CD|nr:RibD family protein [Synechococcus sp. RS9902]QNI98516.1 5-amino-6-(5-phosphoribosylamino)uracil reductase [Synechococcus sp. RS9902]
MPQRPAPSRPFVRLVLAISLDGRLAPPVGGAAQLGGEGDRRALEQALAWADACLIGAGTLRAHRCTCLIRDQQLLKQRAEAGRPQQPTAVVVSNSHEFPADWRFFQQPLQRWLLAPNAPHQGFERWLPLGNNWSQRLQSLADAGVARLVLLGGAALASNLLMADAVDELQLTLVPALLGGENSWLPSTSAALPLTLSERGAWTLTGAEPLGGEELLVRYRRQRH